MHPVLFEIPLPHWSLPLGATLSIAAALGLLLALFGYRTRALDLLLIGIAALLTCGVGALALRGSRFTLVALPVYSYGAMLCLSLVVGWFLTLHLGARAEMKRELLANTYFVAAIAAVLGARVLYVLTNLGEFHSITDVLALRRGGLVAYGGFLGGFLGSWAYLRWRRACLLAWADVAAPSLASGLLLTRIGCYLFGCDFGLPLSETAPSWLKKLGTFPRWPESLLDGAGSPAWTQHVVERGLSATSPSSLPVHPTQLYESLAGALLLAMSLWLGRRQRFRGEIFFALTFGYGLLRFLIEIVRDDSERGTWGPDLPQQWLIPAALVLFSVAFAIGPAREIARVAVRRGAFAALVALPVVAHLWLQPARFAAPTRVALSTSQWVALMTACLVGYFWHARKNLVSESGQAPERAPAK
jgi:phosphatidylglycerol:prolipoprotein diacylglycerol transferase